ncbi:hypothetical protein [Agromyces sp. ZXT2-6]|uniref:hypothetical protein n=1 Tax=Agromyces sp. ZXT2-6 TaxID=3461153 RepID=UPI004054F507
MDVPVFAGMIAAVVFAIANLPMVVKALRTHDVGSYSLGSIAMINAANVVYSLYVFSLPIGPIWLLHSFYLIASAIMLVLCLRQVRTRHGALTSGTAEPRRPAEPIHDVRARPNARVSTQRPTHRSRRAAASVS